MYEYTVVYWMKKDKSWFYCGDFFTYEEAIDYTEGWDFEDPNSKYNFVIIGYDLARKEGFV